MFKKINMEFQLKLSIQTEELSWESSPSKMVFRKQLEREAQEIGHVTSIVKYLPGAKFKQHPHPLGEEIFVLEGTFSDEYGDYPAGSYIRNPPGSAHSPFSKEGCVLFVKLNQFQENDIQQLTVNTNNRSWLAGQGLLEVLPLHNFEGQNTALVKWPKGEVFKPHSHYGGEEILVLHGEFIDEHGRYPKGTWIRSPHLSQHHPYVEKETVIFVKTGHLLL